MKTTYMQFITILKKIFKTGAT